MANRLFNQFRLSLEKQVVELWGKVTVDGAGAVTLVTANSKGIASVVLGTAGKWTITLQDKYRKFLFLDAQGLDADGILAAAVVGLISEDVAGAKTIVIQFSQVGTTPVATNPISSTVFLHITLSNTSAT